MNHIDLSAKIHPSVKMGVFNVVWEDCEIGEGTVIKSHVELRPGTKIGKNCYIDSYVRSSGENKIGDDVTLRFGCTIARQVTIEDGAFISPNVMTIYSDHRGEKHGGIVIGAGAHIGTNAVLHHAVKVGPGAVIGAMSLLTKDALEGTWIGAPARRIQ